MAQLASAEQVKLDMGEVEQFLYLEARLADEHDYDGWEALWTDDALYWVPAGDDDIDPDSHVSIIYDHRRRIATRMEQLRTGRRPTQTPRSRLARLVSNIEVIGQVGEDTEVSATFVLVESREAGNIVVAGRNTYRLRRVDDRILMSYKKVALVDNSRVLPTLSFIL